MKTLFLECNMGAAGDMLMSALSELLPQPELFVEKMNALGLPGVKLERKQVQKMGVGGTQIRVTIAGIEEEQHHHEHNHEHRHDPAPDHTHNHDHGHEHTHNHDHDYSPNHTHNHDIDLAHEHRGMYEIKEMVGQLPVSDKVKEDTLSVYQLIAEAESAIHGKPVAQIHFHEVGAMDAIADILGVSLLMEELAPEQIVASPIHVGCGQIQCAHGILPVPAPATAKILMGVPIYGGTIRGELCTPTGAALLKHFAKAFTTMPEMCVEAVGYGMGKKDFSAVNCVRAFIGDAEILKAGESLKETAGTSPNGQITELSCNLDDMTGEAIAFATETLLENGALDVFLQAIQMKKNRPGVLLTCICKPSDADSMAQLILRHTSSFGVRRNDGKRYTLDRIITTVETPVGEIPIKTGSGYGLTKSKPEYENLAKIAREQKVPLAEVIKAIKESEA